MQSFTGPACTISVYNTGTLTLATLYDSVVGAMSNPFTVTSTGAYQFYAAIGTYDVRTATAAGTYTVSAVNLFDVSSWIPADLFATHAIGVYGSSGSSFKEGFVGGILSQDLLWTLPSSDSAGCLASNGSLTLSFILCQPGGVSGSVQYNSGGSFAGDNNFLWDSVAQSITVAGVAATPAIRVNSGFVQSSGGFFSIAGSWQGFNTNTDGALLRGLHVAQAVSNTTGGYLNLAPITYGTQPSPLPGLSSFGAHSALLWVSPTNAMSADVTQALNTNLFINAAGGFAVCTAVGINCAAAPFNSIQ